MRKTAKATTTMNNLTIEPSFDENHELLAIYIRFAEGRVARIEELSPSFLIDLDENGCLLGVEISQLNQSNIVVVKKIAKEHGVPILGRVKL